MGAETKPTDEQVRDAFVKSARLVEALGPQLGYIAPYADDAIAAFDGWLAARDAALIDRVTERFQGTEIITRAGFVGWLEDTATEIREGRS